jgi:uncharacterized integral membrane protein (TIGR00698 family)
MLAWAGLVFSIGAGVWYKNPAIALLGAMVIRLGTQVNPIKSSSKLGKLSIQTAIVMLGFSLGFDRLVQVSQDFGLIVAIYVLGTLIIGVGFAYLIRYNNTESQLLTGGTAICGGTAIATLSPILGAKPQQFAVATALVFLFNAVALFTFPAIGHSLGLSQDTFGAWVALAVHDTSSVVATAALYGDRALEVATTVKLGRTLWLIPLAFAASVVFRQGDAKLRVPLFVVLFVAAAGFAGLVDVPEALLVWISAMSKYLLVFALAMIGLDINREIFSTLKFKSVAFAVGLWLIVAPLSLVLVQTLG